MQKSARPTTAENFSPRAVALCISSMAAASAACSYAASKPPGGIPPRAEAGADAELPPPADDDASPPDFEDGPFVGSSTFVDDGDHEGCLNCELSTGASSCVRIDVSFGVVGCSRGE